MQQTNALQLLESHTYSPAGSAAQLALTCSFEFTFRIELSKSVTIWFQNTKFYGKKKKIEEILAPLFSPPRPALH